VSAKDTPRKGTTVNKKYQKNAPKTSTGPGLAVPDAVTIAMGEIAEDMREGLLALAVGAGLQLLGSLMEADVAAACGPRGRHDPERTAVRHGTERRSVTLGGRRTSVQRPRMRDAGGGGGGEVPLPSYELFSSSEMLGRMAMDKMIGGLSSRRYRVGLEPVGEKVERTASATSKSAVSRRFVAMTETALAELLAAPLGQLDLVALMIDGVHSAGTCASWGWESASTAPSTRWGWSKAAPKTRPWSPICSPTCASGAWTRPARSWSASTAARRYTPGSWRCSTTR
jgi:putative transposase